MPVATPAAHYLTLASAAYSTVVANSVIETWDLGHYGCRELFALLDVTAAATDTGDTLDIFIDGSPDGTTYYNVIHFTQILGDSSAAKYFALSGALAAAEENVTSDVSAGAAGRAFFGRYIRVRHTLVDADANAEFTYSLQVIAR